MCILPADDTMLPSLFILKQLMEMNLMHIFYEATFQTFALNQFFHWIKTLLVVCPFAAHDSVAIMRVPNVVIFLSEFS